jgi:hypothetical protein
MAADGLTLTATPLASVTGAFAVAGTTLYPSSAAMTISGQIVSAGSAGLMLLGPDTAADSMTGAGTVLAAGFVAITAAGVMGSPLAVSVAGTTLSAGGDALMLPGGGVVSAGSSGLVPLHSNSTAGLASILANGTGSSTVDVGTGPTRGSAAATPVASGSQTVKSGGKRSTELILLRWRIWAILSVVFAVLVLL